MAQISRPQGGLRATYPDAGAYTAVEWADRIAPVHSGDDFDDSGVIPNNANYLNCTTAAGDITVDTGRCCVHGHILTNDSAVTISPTHPGAPDTYTVVAVQNDTTVAYNTNLDTPAPYAAGIPAYSTRLAILQDTTLVQNASYWMIPIFTFDINAAGAVSNLTDAREWIDSRFMIDNADDTGIADAHQIGAHAVTDTGGDTGMGVAIRSWLANAANTFLSVGRMVWRWSVATAASERSRIELRTMYQSNEVLSGVIEAPATASADGNARGVGAVDTQGYRGAAAEVASGDYAVIGGGQENTASGDYNVISGGRDNTASADYATVSGGHTNTATSTYASVGGGLQNDATGNYSTVAGGDDCDASGAASAIGGGGENAATAPYSTIPGGIQGLADHYGQVAAASGEFGNVGDAQGTIQMVARCTTAGGGAATTMYLDGAAGAQRMTIPADSAWTYDILVVAMAQNAAAVHSSRTYGVIYRDNANNTTQASATGVVVEQAGGCTTAVDADDVNEALRIQFTDDSANVFRAVATIRLAQVSYP
jgi:hypothetical protein